MSIEIKSNNNPLNTLQINTEIESIQAPKKGRPKKIEVIIKNEEPMTVKDVIEQVVNDIEPVVEPLKVDEIVEVEKKKRGRKKKEADPNEPPKPPKQKRAMTEQQLENLKNGRLKGREKINEKHAKINENKLTKVQEKTLRIKELQEKALKDEEDMLIKEAIKLKKKQLEKQKVIETISEPKEPTYKPPPKATYKPPTQPQQNKLFNGYTVNFI